MMSCKRYTPWAWTALLFQITTCVTLAQPTYFPGHTWETKRPADVAMDSERLNKAIAFALENKSSTDPDLRVANFKAYAREPDYRILGPMGNWRHPSGVVIKNGYIAAQWGDVKRVEMTFSVTKSYLSTVAGLALDMALIQDLDDAVHPYVWDETFQGPHHQKITWRHLLTQSSDWSGCLFEICDWADRPPKEGTIDDWRNRKLLEPGSQFEYNDVRVNLLAYCLLHVFRKPLPVVLKEKVMDPIGASTTWRWYGYDNSFINMDGMMMQSVSGGGHFGGGLFINALDHARFGLLFLRKGKWKDQRLISEAWIEQAIQPSSANPSYGLMWWLNTEERLKGVSKNIYTAEGFGGNFIVVDEEHDLVIVARWLEPGKLGEFVRMVVEACMKKKD